jgi:hypothetical protein
MHAIGFVRHHFLPPSETFIYTSLRALVDYKVRVLALPRDQSAKFPFGDVTLLSDSSPLAAEALLYRRLRLVAARAALGAHGQAHPCPHRQRGGYTPR